MHCWLWRLTLAVLLVWGQFASASKFWVPTGKCEPEYLGSASEVTGEGEASFTVCDDNNESANVNDPHVHGIITLNAVKLMEKDLSGPLSLFIPNARDMVSWFKEHTQALLNGQLQADAGGNKSYWQSSNFHFPMNTFTHFYNPATKKGLRLSAEMLPLVMLHITLQVNKIMLEIEELKEERLYYFLHLRDRFEPSSEQHREYRVKDLRSISVREQGAALTRAMSMCGVVRESSPATEYADYRYARAVHFMRLGDTQQAATELSHSAHFIQDMAVPQHSTDLAAGVPMTRHEDFELYIDSVVLKDQLSMAAGNSTQIPYSTTIEPLLSGLFSPGAHPSDLWSIPLDETHKDSPRDVKRPTRGAASSKLNWLPSDLAVKLSMFSTSMVAAATAKRCDFRTAVSTSIPSIPEVSKDECEHREFLLAARTTIPVAEKLTATLFTRFWVFWRDEKFRVVRLVIKSVEGFEGPVLPWTDSKYKNADVVSAPDYYARVFIGDSDYKTESMSNMRVLWNLQACSTFAWTFGKWIDEDTHELDVRVEIWDFDWSDEEWGSDFVNVSDRNGVGRGSLVFKFNTETGQVVIPGQGTFERNVGSGETVVASEGDGGVAAKIVVKMESYPYTM